MSKTSHHLALVLSFMGCAEEQKPLDCSPCRMGRFEETMLPGYIITRTRTTQYEEWGERAQVTESKLIWLDDCTYAITAAQTTKGQPYPLAADDTLKVTIIGVDAEGCDYAAVLISSNPELDKRETSGRQLFYKEER